MRSSSEHGRLHRTKRRWSVAGAACCKLEIVQKHCERRAIGEIGSKSPSLFEVGKSETSLVQLPGDAPIPHVECYAYRSFDRHWVIADTRLGDFLRPDLWRAHSDKQVYLTSLFTQALGSGPALTSSALIPDLHHFRGSYGAKNVFPLYRTADASQANILPSLLEMLGVAYQRAVTPEVFLTYVYGVLAQPAFTTRFVRELETRDLRVPITRDAALFERVRAVGARLLWLHTYGERFVPRGQAARSNSTRRGEMHRSCARRRRRLPRNIRL